MLNAEKGQKLPIEAGTYVITPAGEGQVTGYNQSTVLITVWLEDGTESEFPEEEVDEKKE